VMEVAEVTPFVIVDVPISGEEGGGEKASHPVSFLTTHFCVADDRISLALLLLLLLLGDDVQRQISVARASTPPIGAGE